MHEKIRLLAEKYHEGQFRKGKEHLPYIVHPEAVARELLAWGEPEDSPAIAMAWGHDLLEDTPVSKEEILAAAGERVLKGIIILTRPRKKKKSLYLRQVAESGDREALLVKLADRICNSRDFVKLKGARYALDYLHLADVVRDAVAALPPGDVVGSAIAAWHVLDRELDGLIAGIPRRVE